MSIGRTFSGVFPKEQTYDEARTALMALFKYLCVENRQWSEKRESNIKHMPGAKLLEFSGTILTRKEGSE
ncbi:MAG: hypothetical protein E3J82_01175 [Candidatus Thorarchaeota archaeon]|nr:MAG: hypothetical protein E3J82_01175 [Candidatus Thorarchaeota archaeon]